MAKYQFNKGDMDRFTAEKRHAEGNFARLITAAERHESENNDHVMGVITSKALESPDDPNSLVAGTELKTWVTLPISNPDVDGHEAPDYSASMWAEFCSAVFPEDCIAPPRRIEFDDTKQKMTGPMYFQGEPVENDENTLLMCKADAYQSCGVKAPEVAEDWDILVGRGYFCNIGLKKDNEGRERINQRAFRSELPEHWELSDSFVNVISMIENKMDTTDKKKAGKKKKGSSRRK